MERGVPINMSEQRWCKTCKNDTLPSASRKACWSCQGHNNWEAKVDAQISEEETKQSPVNGAVVPDPVGTADAGDNRNSETAATVTRPCAECFYEERAGEKEPCVSCDDAGSRFKHKHECEECKHEGTAVCFPCVLRGSWEPKAKNPAAAEAAAARMQALPELKICTCSTPTHRCQGEAPVAAVFTRADLAAFIEKETAGINGLFAYKNQDYGEAGDAFANFRKTAQRILIPAFAARGAAITEREAMFLTLLTLFDKHAVALSQTGIAGNEAGERLSDLAVYALIGKAMIEHA